MAVPTSSRPQRSAPDAFRWMPADLPDNDSDKLKELQSMGLLCAEDSNLTWRAVHRLTHCRLTDMPASQLFQSRLEYLLNHTDNRFALIVVNCQRFRVINELYGQDTADAVLRTLSRRIKRLKQPSVMFARLRDDRFGFIVNKAHQHHTDEFIDNLKATLSRPMRFRGYHYRLGFAVGVNWREQGERISASQLMLDTEMNVSSAQNKMQQEYVAVTQHPRMVPQLHQSLQDKLHHALRQDTLDVRVTPIVNLRSGSTYSYQALPHFEDNGEALPLELIMRQAERGGFMLQLTEYLIKKSLAQFRNVRQQPVYLCVKVSRVDMCNTRLTQLAMQELARHDIDEFRLQLELHDENHADGWQEIVNEIFELSRAECPSQFKRHAVGSSHLRNETLQVSKVFWVRRSILQQALDESQQLQMLRTTIDLARSLGVDVMASEIDSEGQRSLAMELGILYASGDLVGTPAPLEFLR